MNTNIYYLVISFLIFKQILSTEGTFTFGLSKLTGRYKENIWEQKQNRLLESSGDSSIIFGNSTSLNYYYVNIYIGSPPQRQSVIIDTGSHFFATPCQPYCTHCGNHLNSYYDMSKSNSSEMITCEGNENCIFRSTCNADKRCAFSSSYGEGSSLSGVIIKDIIKFGDTFQQFPPALMEFGCTTSENKLFYTQEADGIMGLGPSESSFVSKLFKSNAITQKLFTLCFAPNGGYFSVGGINTILHSGSVEYIPFYERGFYKVKIKDVVINDDVLQISDDRFYTIIDSGTTVTYFPKALFDDVEDKVNKYCSQLNRCLGDIYNSDLGICFKLKENVNFLQFKESMPYLTFHFEGNVKYEWKPESYLFDNSDQDYPKSSFCMGFVSWGSNEILLGSTWMHNHDIVFDIENSRIGLVDSKCGEVLKLKPAPNNKDNTTVSQNTEKTDNTTTQTINTNNTNVDTNSNETSSNTNDVQPANTNTDANANANANANTNSIPNANTNANTNGSANDTVKGDNITNVSMNSTLIDNEKQNTIMNKNDIPTQTCDKEIEMYKTLLIWVCCSLGLLIILFAIALKRLKNGQSFLWLRLPNTTIENQNLRQMEQV